MRKFCFCTFIALFLFNSFANGQIRLDSLRVLVREYAFTVNPNLNSNTKFNVTDCEVDNLWEKVQMQIFNVEYVNQGGTAYRHAIFIYHNNSVEPFGNTFGG